MSIVNAETLAVSSAIRQSFERGATGAVNSHPNPYFVNLNGPFDLVEAAELAIKTLDTHREALRAKEAKSINAQIDANVARRDAEI
jgi:hypothetical protein